MNLKHIKDEVCPHCGSQAISEYKSASVHCNGTSEESRHFSCNCELTYSPNFRNVTETKVCEKSQEFKEKETLKLERIHKIENYMKKTLKMSAEDVKDVIYGMWRKL